MKSGKKRAFTLSELLVVIAVIAVLMAILMPALRMARSQAKRTVCCNNVKQMGVGLHMYADAWDGKILPYTNTTGATYSYPSSQLPWTGVVVYAPDNQDNQGDDYAPMHLAILYEQKLIKDPKVFYCPAQPNITDYPLQYNYKFYTDNGKRAWGTYIPEAYGGGHVRVRTSYNYWDHPNLKTKLLDQMAQYPIIVDNLHEWEVVPHRVGDRPQGVSALFGDGHVNFCMGVDLFENDIWPRLDGVYNGPGDNTEVFEALLKIIRLNHQ